MLNYILNLIKTRKGYTTATTKDIADMKRDCKHELHCLYIKRLGMKESATKENLIEQSLDLEFFIQGYNS